MRVRAKKLKRSMSVLVKDLELLGAVYVAHFIVWREIRRSEREKARRRKNIKLVRRQL